MNKLSPTDNLYEWKAISELMAEGSEQKIIDDLSKISNTSISDLISDNENILVFSDSTEGSLSNNSSYVISLKYKKIKTGNIMGFVGINETLLSIRSRFAKEDKEDYFLHYMLEKVFSINLFNYPTQTSDESVFDFLLFQMFPYYLKKALSQGLFKKYRRFEHNDANIKGPVDLVRHITKNIPFRGTVAYNTREQSCDNEVTQLIRHTIEFLRTSQTGSMVLQNDTETRECVSQIMYATESYSKNQRQRIISKNLRPVSHPYFTEYKDLQKICLKILRREGLKYGENKDRVYGILFDGAWLWEEYLWTVLKELGFIHPKNKTKENPVPIFENHDNELDKNTRKLYPDFWKDGEDRFILDAKYKHLNNGPGREDLYQVVTYMHCTKAGNGGYVYPCEDEGDPKKYKLTGYNGFLHIIPFYIPQDAVDYKDFSTKIKGTEGHLADYIQSLSTGHKKGRK